MKIVVLAGGISTERDVSISSGTMIYNALKTNGHEVTLLDVYLGIDLFSEQNSSISESNPDIEQIKAMRCDTVKGFFGPGVIERCREADVVFIALHGENGENGKVQACFDLLGITYTGTDYVSSAICMDKGLTKDILSGYGIVTPVGIRMKKDKILKWQADYPCIVKASCGGSSVGVCIARSEAEYDAALTEAFQYDEEVIVEQYIEGREFSVGVMDGKALPVIEIAPLEGFYDYKNKYQPGATVETCPAQLADNRTAELQQIAEKAFLALRLKNYARLDFMMNAKGEFFCLEANTLPGMTPTSLLPQEAAAEGVNFAQLCEKIIKSALRK